MLGQVAFAQADTPWGHLHQFILLNEVQGLLQAHQDRGGETYSDICSGRTDIGALLLLTNRFIPQLRKTLALVSLFSRKYSTLGKRQTTTSSFE